MSKGQFSRLPAAAVFDKGLHAGALRVLAALGTYADQNGCCYPSVVTLAERLGITRRMVQLHLRALEEAGYLVTEPRAKIIEGKGINVYQLQYPAVPYDAKQSFASGVSDDANPDFASSVTDPPFLTRNPETGDAKVSDADAKSNVAVTRNGTSHNLSQGISSSKSAHEAAQGPLRGKDVLNGSGGQGGKPRRVTPEIDYGSARRNLASRIERIWNLNGVPAADVLNCLPVEIERPLYLAEAQGTGTDDAVSEVLRSARGQQALATAERLLRERRSDPENAA